MSFWLDDALLPEAVALLDGASISYVRKNQSLTLTVDKQMIEVNATLLQKLAALVKQSWEK